MTLANPAVRWGLSIASAALIAAIALFAFDGVIQIVLLVIAALDLITTPRVLKKRAYV